MATRGDAALVTGRADASGTYMSSGIVAHTYRVPFPVHADAHSIRLVFANRRLIRTVGECDGEDAVTVRAVLEEPGGALWPVLFGGRDEGRMEAGGEVAADALPIVLRRGQTMFLRLRPRVDAPGGRWPLGGAPLPGTAGGGGGAGAAAPDAPADAFTQAGILPFLPAMILGTPLGPPPPGAIILGYSTAYGSGDRAGEDGSYGFLARLAHRAGIPHLRLAAPALALGHVIGAGTAEVPMRTRHLRALVDRARPAVALVSMGNNDVHRSVFTLEQNQAAMLRYLDLLAGCGLGVVACTITPRTTGAWGEAATQAPVGAAVNRKRHAFNDWLRARPHPALADVWDVAAIAQDPADPDRWTTDGGAWTADGTHMNAHGNRRVAAALAERAALLAG